MRPPCAATTPLSTMPSPGPVRVASRALCQSVSQFMARAFLGRSTLSLRSAKPEMQREAAGMKSLWFQSALLSDGWAQNVRVTVGGAAITRIEKDVQPADDARHGIAIPGLANLHSHAFQRGMAGLAEVRGPAHDSFWTWRDVMY